MPIFPGACAGDARLSGGVLGPKMIPVEMALFREHSFVFYGMVHATTLLKKSIFGEFAKWEKIHPNCSK